MKDVVIEVEHLTKMFLLSHSGASSLKTALLWWRRRRMETLVALDDVSLRIERGECAALVGRNGAGKSTLLAILARVYRPTSGAVHANGRIAPLLELGAGFHPDLTGVENVVFNGVVLGLSRREAMNRLDRIVEFSELHNHIDAPIRTYSSGMLARLGFAVAANVDADIMIVDEVLAVGDYAFEEKCYLFIEEFRRSGGTVLFVSHNLAAVLRVADRAMWLDAGRVALDGPPVDVVDAYRKAAPTP